MAAGRRRNSPSRSRGRPLARRPTVVRVAIAALVLLVGVGAYQLLRPKPAPDRQPEAESARHSVPTPPPAPAPAKTTAAKTSPPKPIVAQRDPALDAWFVAAYLGCWKPPAIPAHGEPYAAQIRVVHNADGSLAAPPQLVNPPTDPEWRAYAESAVNAVAKCPLQIPAPYLARFDQWRKMTLHFAPDGAL